MSILGMFSNKSLSFEIGEKQVRTVFKSLLSFGIVVLPSIEPVTRAVSILNFVFTNLLTFSYR